MAFSLVYGGKSNLWLGKFDIFPQDKFIHAVSTRHGGFSTADFSSLNLGLHVDDDAGMVWQNRAAFFDGLGLYAGTMVTCQQVHGTNIAKVGKIDRGRGAKVYADAIPDTDALITNEPNVPLLLFFADCTPILIADPVKRAIGVAHGGWKGTVGGIAMKTVEAMRIAYGCNPANMLAVVGPAIGPCCYEVGKEVVDKFKDAFPEMVDEIFSDGSADGKAKLNLWRCNELQLIKSGLEAKNVQSANVCTSCNNQQFFSYRADKGKTGRIGAVLCIK